MSEVEFKYDVAFSFHSSDQGMAVSLNDLLQDRFKTFIYLQRQEDVLAGTDGEVTFNAVFGEESRCVVVFCRKEWGETPFTRIEQTAIRNRAFKEGFEFSLFIPTDSPPTVPKWLPKTQLWYGIGEHGMNGAAAVVERLIEHSVASHVLRALPIALPDFNAQRVSSGRRRDFVRVPKASTLQMQHSNN